MYIRDTAVNRCLAHDAWGGQNWVRGLWVVPGGSAVVGQLVQAVERRPARWVSQVDPGAPARHSRHRWSVRAVRWGSLFAPPALPRPRHVPVDEPGPIVEWMADVRRSGQVPHLYTFAASAVRVCQAARDRGADLRDAAFTLIGEPVTAARLAVIRGAGAVAVVDYGASEVASFAFGCREPATPDDVHLCHDLLAAIQAGPGGPAAGLPADAILLSTIRPTAPVIPLNVSLGDRARLDTRGRGCPVAAPGWPTHLAAIRSFETLRRGAGRSGTAT